MKTILYIPIRKTIDYGTEWTCSTRVINTLGPVSPEQEEPLQQLRMLLRLCGAETATIPGVKDAE